LQPCQECHGSKLASVAYDTVRVHYKRNEEVKDVLLEAVKDALASEKQFRMSKVPTEPEVEKR
jgi:excinuclease UvrABC ATPase subunit